MKYLLICIISVSIFFTACSFQKTENRGEKYGGTLHINSSDVPDIIFPGQVLKTSEQLIVSQVYCGLLKYHPKTLEVVPSLANDWKSEANKTKFIFYLNRSAFFHDDPCFEKGVGRRINSKDVKYSIEQVFLFHLKRKHEISKQIKNIKGVNSVISNNLETKNLKIDGIKTPNDSTVIFELINPDAMFFHFLASTNSLVFPKEAFEKYGYRSTVGSGAFKFSYPEIKGKSITLTANPNYFGTSKRGEQLPYIDTIVTSFITSPPQELHLFENGKLDLIIGVNRNYVTDFLEIHIDKFQSNPPYYIMKQTVDDFNNIKYNFLRSNIRNFEINSLGYFDLSNVYFKEPVGQEVKVLN